MEAIAIASDHGGYHLKKVLTNFLQELGYRVEDLGTTSEESVDYPVFALALAEQVANGKFLWGILICTTGIGMSIVANKVPGVRAALCHDSYSARLSRLHNHANVLCLGGQVIGPELAKVIVREWLQTGFESGRHEHRVNIIRLVEEKYCIKKTP